MTHSIIDELVLANPVPTDRLASSTPTTRGSCSTGSPRRRGRAAG